jgi:hypothetical protein
MRKILIFLLIPLIIKVYADDASMLMAKAEINAGMAAISQFVPGGEVIAGFLTPFFDEIFGIGEPDPNAVILEKLDALRDEIMNRLTLIQNELQILKNEILNEIQWAIYENSFGGEIDKLKIQIEDLFLTLNTTNYLKDLSKNEKIVESAYKLGSNNQWDKEGNIIFRLENLANILAGQSFTDIDQRDLYQIVYDSFIARRMFSGEAYDDADYYIEKVMNIYFYGCSAIFQGLKNIELMTNFTNKDIESLSSIVKFHFYNTAVSSPKYISDKIKSIADKVFDIKNKDSVVSHYLAFKYKKNFVEIFL